MAKPTKAQESKNSEPKKQDDTNRPDTKNNQPPKAQSEGLKKFDKFKKGSN